MQAVMHLPAIAQPWHSAMTDNAEGGASGVLHACHWPGIWSQLMMTLVAASLSRESMIILQR